MKINTQVKKRVFAPLTKHFALETDYVEINGERGVQELVSSPDLVRVADLDEYNGVLDMDAAHNSSAEVGEIELTLKIKEDAEGNPNADEVLVYLGLSEWSIKFAPQFQNSIIDYTDLIIGGTYGSETLDVIADLAKNGTSLTLTYIHATAEDSKAFTHKPTHKKFRHDGASDGDKRYPFPRAGSRDENTSIREIDNVAIVLDGFSGLELSVLAGTPVSFQIDTVYLK